VRKKLSIVIATTDMLKNLPNIFIIFRKKKIKQPLDITIHYGRF